MVCFCICGLRFALDFTAPALLALLTMVLPPQAVLQTAAACLLHESAHLLTAALTGQKPALLHISAAGLRLETQGSAVLPLRRFAAVLAAGPAANLAAAAGFRLLGMHGAAAANLSLCLFNLLPFRSTDGGTMLHAALEERFLQRAPEIPRRVMRVLSLLAAGGLLLGMYAVRMRNISLTAMLVYMLIAEWM